MKAEKFPHPRKFLHWQRWEVAGVKLQSHGGECSNRGAEGKAERFPNRGLVLTSLTNLRGLSVHLPGRVGAGSGGSGFTNQIPERGLGLAA